MKRFILCFVCLCSLMPGVPAFSQSTASGIILKKPSVPVSLTATEEKSPSMPQITPQPFIIPDVQRVISPKGIEAWLIEEKSTPAVAMTVLFKGGSASDPQRLTGLSDLTMSLLDEGAGRMNAEKFQEKLAEKAIHMSFDSSPDYVSADIQTLAKNKKEAFNLLRMALTKPRFDRNAVRRVKKQMQAGIEARKGNPVALSYDRWQKLVFDGHPYSRLQPTSESIEDIRRSNLKQYVKNRFARDNMVIGVAGNISAAELSALLDETFAGLPSKSHVQPVKPVEPKVSPRIDVISMDVPQSAAVFGHKGISRDDPDFYSALLVTHIFGSSGLSSRLFKEVREDRGLTYGVSTYLSTLKASPMLSGSASSDNAKMAEAIKIIQDEWKKMSDSGPAESELKDAKTYMTGSFPLTFSSNADLSSFLAGMQYNNLGLTYLKERNALIESVTLEQAQKTARRLLTPDKLFFVVIGKPANL